MFPVEAVAIRFCPTLLAPSSSPAASTTCTSFAPLFESSTAPVKSLAFARVITPAPPLNVAVPAPASWVIVSAPFCVMPTASNCSVPLPTLTTPSVIAFVSLFTRTLFPPLFDRSTTPLKLFAKSNVIAFAPAVKLPLPLVTAALWVMAPAAVIVTFAALKPIVFTVPITIPPLSW